MTVRNNFLTAEPLVVRTVAALAVGAALNLIVEFGVNVSDGQQTAIQGAVTAVLAVFFLLTTRPVVTPTAEVAVQDDGTGAVAGEASPLEDGTPVTVEAVLGR